MRDTEVNKKKPDGDGSEIMQKCECRFSQSVQDASHGGRQIQEWAEPGQDRNKFTGIVVLEDGYSELFSKNCKDANTEDAHVEAVSDRQGKCFSDTEVIPGSLLSGNGWQKNDSQGIDDSGGKHDKGHRHACENSINAD